jgi:hypothetical protein
MGRILPVVLPVTLECAFSGGLGRRSSRLGGQLATPYGFFPARAGPPFPPDCKDLVLKFSCNRGENSRYKGWTAAAVVYCHLETQLRLMGMLPWADWIFLTLSALGKWNMFPLCVEQSFS